MTIKDASVDVGTTISTSGGTATTFLDSGDGPDSHQVTLDDSSEFINATTVSFSVKRPKVQTLAPNGYTQKRSTVVIQRPLALDNGNRTVNTFRLELAVDIETTAAEIDSLRELASQICFDSDYDEFWQNLSTG
jgi:hypothetical protein